MKHFPVAFAAIRRMPGGIRIAALFFLLLAVGLPATSLPNGEQFFTGDKQAAAEFLRHGGRVLFLVVGSVSALLFYGFVRARRWARHLALISGWAVTVASFLSWRSLTLEFVWVLLCFGCVPVWYLYFRPSVRAYFEAHHEIPVA
jgi:hypothetical protein